MNRSEAFRENVLNRVRPSVAVEEFDFRKEHFKRLYWDSENKMAIFRRTNIAGGLIAYEVVIGKGEKLSYPTDNDFGKYGWCYSGHSDEKLKQMIKDKYGIILP